MKNRFLITLLFCILASPVFAWNATGHKVIAEIAYENLTPTVKIQINTLLSARFRSRYEDGRFLQAATWPDRMKSHNKKYNMWHFIDMPLVADHVMPPSVDPKNVVWAISYAEQMVKNTDISKKTRAKYLSFLIHFVGDIHQPMHCITRYSHRTPPPQGDLGGNLFPIQSPIADNLHAYWDGGLGLFQAVGTHKYVGYHQMINMANHWMGEYPKSYFAKQLAIQSPQAWAQESYLLAKNVAYHTSMNAAPSRDYNLTGRQVVREQVVLAGYRLANILNQLFS